MRASTLHSSSSPLLLAMLGGQLAIGATNELIDLPLDAIGKPHKPLPRGDVTVPVDEADGVGPRDHVLEQGGHVDQGHPLADRRVLDVVVVGGETNGYWQVMGSRRNATVSVDDWR